MVKLYQRWSSNVLTLAEFQCLPQELFYFETANAFYCFILFKHNSVCKNKYDSICLRRSYFFIYCNLQWKEVHGLPLLFHLNLCSVLNEGYCIAFHPYFLDKLFPVVELQQYRNVQSFFICKTCCLHFF